MNIIFNCKKCKTTVEYNFDRNIYICTGCNIEYKPDESIEILLKENSNILQHKEI
jgi:hypothetical protein